MACLVADDVERQTFFYDFVETLWCFLTEGIGDGCWEDFFAVVMKLSAGS